MNDLNKMLKINQIAAKYFSDQLKVFGKEHVFNRINEKTAKDFNIGFAPSKNNLSNTLQKCKAPADLCQEVGLIVIDKSGLSHDIFVNRIVFPIRHAGFIVGFGGRTVVDSSAKYINSRASRIYDKSNILYGLWHNRKFIEKAGFAIAVEGYFDLLSLYDRGIKNEVAPCGVALTKEHLFSLRRYTNKLILMFDGDKAGVKATASVEKQAEKIINVKSITLPSSMDPEEFITKYGAEKLVKRVKNAIKFS